MTHPELETLHGFAEGRLEDAAGAEVAAHLDACPACRDEVRWVRELRQEARGLPESLAPERDLWPGIEAGIRRSARSPQAPVGSIDAARRRNGGWRRPLLLAAAALALVALSSVITYSIVRSGAAGSAGAIAGGSGEGEGGIDAPEPVRFVSAAEELERAYEPAIREMEEALASDRDRLRPETVQTLEENLRIIDEAIREAHEALAADPGSATAARSLNGMYDTKVQVLRQATRLLQGA